MSETIPIQPPQILSSLTLSIHCDSSIKSILPLFPAYFIRHFIHQPMKIGQKIELTPLYIKLFITVEQMIPENGILSKSTNLVILNGVNKIRNKQSAEIRSFPSADAILQCFPSTRAAFNSFLVSALFSTSLVGAEFPRLAALIGAEGTGKTAFLRALFDEATQDKNSRYKTIFLDSPVRWAANFDFCEILDSIENGSIQSSTTPILILIDDLPQCQNPDSLLTASQSNNSIHTNSLNLPNPNRFYSLFHFISKNPQIPISIFFTINNNDYNNNNDNNNESNISLNSISNSSYYSLINYFPRNYNWKNEIKLIPIEILNIQQRNFILNNILNKIKIQLNKQQIKIYYENQLISTTSNSSNHNDSIINHSIDSSMNSMSFIEWNSMISHRLSVLTGGFNPLLLKKLCYRIFSRPLITINNNNSTKNNTNNINTDNNNNNNNRNNNRIRLPSGLDEIASIVKEYENFSEIHLFDKEINSISMEMRKELGFHQHEENNNNNTNNYMNINNNTNNNNNNTTTTNNNNSNSTWNEFCGYSSLKSRLELILYQWKTPEKLKQLGIKPISGLLLHGPSGVGKSLIANEFAKQSGFNVVSVSCASLFSPYLGESERAIRLLFARCSRAAPCILFLDSIDSIAFNRSSGDAGLADRNSVETRVLSSLLNELDGISSRIGVYLLSCTNSLNSLDNAILRPGRFDELIEIELPNLTDRIEILKDHCKNYIIPKEEIIQSEFNNLAQITSGWTGSKLASLAREIGISSLRRTIKSMRNAKIKENPEFRNQFRQENEKIYEINNENNNNNTNDKLTNTGGILYTSINGNPIEYDSDDDDFEELKYSLSIHDKDLPKIIEIHSEDFQSAFNICQQTQRAQL